MARAPIPHPGSDHDFIVWLHGYAAAHPEAIDDTVYEALAARITAKVAAKIKEEAAPWPKGPIHTQAQEDAMQKYAAIQQQYSDNLFKHIAPDGALAVRGYVAPDAGLKCVVQGNSVKVV